MRGIIISAEIVAGVFTLMILIATLKQYHIIRSKSGRTYILFVAAVTAGLFSDAVSYSGRKHGSCGSDLL